MTASRARPLIPLLLIAAIVLTLWPVCLGQFTLWDDIGVIAHAPTLLPPTWHSLVAWWTRPILYLYIPVSYTVWGLIALIAQRPGEGGVFLSPFPFHLANLLLHVLTAIVVYRLLLLLVKKPWPAAAGAALFALHPVQVESVAWAMGLRDVLCGLFTITAVWQYLLGAVRPLRAGVYDSGLRSKRLGRNWHFPAATLCYALALLSKPSAITTPLIAAALEIALLTAPSKSSLTTSATPRRSRRIPLPLASILRLSFWFLLALPIALIARHEQPTYRVSETVPLLHRPLVAIDAIAFYMGKIACPINLSMDYARSPAKIFDNHQAYWTWLIPTAILAAYALLFHSPGRKARFFAPAQQRTGASAPGYEKPRIFIIAGAAIFVLALLPVLGFVGFDFQSYSTVADHYLYVPMLGVALIAASILSMPASVRHRRIAAASATFILGALAFQSFRQTWVWQNTDTLFAHALAIDPLGPAVNDTLARAALDAGNGELAEQYAQKSIRGNPRRSQGYVLLAQAPRLQGHWRPAWEAANTACRIEPNDPAVVMALAALLDDSGDPAATAMYRKAIGMDPAMPEAHLGLGINLAHIGQKTQAIAELQKAAELAPTDPYLQVQIGDELAGLGQYAAARSAYQTALRLQPGFDPATDGLLALPR